MINIACSHLFYQVVFWQLQKVIMMASSEGTESDSRTNSLTNRSFSESNHNDDDIHPQEMKGWLLKRTKISRKWKKQWFLLKSANLLYGDSPEVITLYLSFIILCYIYIEDMLMSGFLAG